MVIPGVYKDLLVACKLPGCPICHLVEQSTRRYMSNLFYEHVNDGGLRARLRKSLGFCHEHAWLALEPGMGDALGVAIIYHDVLKNLLKNLPKADANVTRKGYLTSMLERIRKRSEDKLSKVLRAFVKKVSCPACEQLKDSTDLYLSELVGALQKDEMSDALKDSSGLCIPHLRQAFEFIRDEKTCAILLSISRDKISALDHELMEIIRKKDYRFQAEGFGDEKDAWRRVVGLVVGERRGIEGNVIEKH